MNYNVDDDEDIEYEKNLSLIYEIISLIDDTFYSIIKNYYSFNNISDFNVYIQNIHDAIMLIRKKNFSSFYQINDYLNNVNKFFIFIKTNLFI